MSSDRREVDNVEESEFGLGMGLIDDRSRAERAIPVEQELWEIYALPKTFDGSMPDRKTPEETPVPRLLPGEEEEDRT
jgi:hypothetical protein